MRHGDTRRDGADTTGNGSDGVNDRLNLVEVHIAAQRTARIEVDAHIEHRLPRTEVFLAERARAFGKEYFRAGQTVLDVGINFDSRGTLCGDVNFDEVEPVVDAITPVPGGIGTVTTSVTMAHVVDAAEKMAGR